jgi:hypothetical protein
MRSRPVLALALLAACSSPEDLAARKRLDPEQERPPAATFEWSRPEGSLAIGAGEVAARIGSFEWTATVTWSASQAGGDKKVRAVERHRVRQAASGEFEVESEIDPSEGEGEGEGEVSESGKHVIYAGKATYARSRFAPFGGFRVRPTDRGRDARRFRDESFGLAADLASLCGPALRAEPAGEETFLSRRARRFRLSLQPGKVDGGGPSRLGVQPPDGGPDEDTRRRLAFLDGRVPLRAEGELLADAESGAPLKARLRAAFLVKQEPEVRVEVDLAAQMRTLGSATPPVTAPKGALPDERKPRGVARALEAAGLKKAREPEQAPDERGEEGE